MGDTSELFQDTFLEPQGGYLVCGGLHVVRLLDYEMVSHGPVAPLQVHTLHASETKQSRGEELRRTHAAARGPRGAGETSSCEKDLLRAPESRVLRLVDDGEVGLGERISRALRVVLGPAETDRRMTTRADWAGDAPGHATGGLAGSSRWMQSGQLQQLWAKTPLPN